MSLLENDFDAPPLDLVPAPKVVPFEDLTANQKLRRLQQEIKAKMGKDWNPVLRLAELAEQLILDGDPKTAVIALNSVADRLHPKLKAHEIVEQTQDVIIVAADPNEPTSRRNTRLVV